ncbi:MAG TPA: tetratricopeptide repeat protein [Candidatus Acidoferrales bacterium]|jgi:tetratricopeptide (TPR) repeat protein|nr:tetratricopeptide repeat protein [Candidatus Acidoferrales bacterium]
MTLPQRSRREILEGFVAANPKDAFARYGLAQECASAGDTGAALEHYAALLAAHPDYVPGYYHYGTLLDRLGRKEEARKILTEGVAAARKAGNSHAQSEMEAALQEASL